MSPPVGPVAITAWPVALQAGKNPMPVRSGTVCALEVAFATPDHLFLLAYRSTPASLLRCLLVTLGDLSAEIVEGRFGRRFSRARLLTGPVGLLTLLRPVCALLVAPYGRLGRWKNARAGSQAVEAASDFTGRSGAAPTTLRHRSAALCAVLP